MCARFRRRSLAAGELAVRPLPGRLPDSRDEPRMEEKTPTPELGTRPEAIREADIALLPITRGATLQNRSVYFPRWGL